MPDDAGTLSGGEVNLDDIETDGYIPPQQAQPIPSTDAQVAAFGRVDGTRGGTGFRRSGAFDLTHDEEITIASHDIELPGTPPTEITAQDA